MTVPQAWHGQPPQPAANQFRPWHTALGEFLESAAREAAAFCGGSGLGCGRTRLRPRSSWGGATMKSTRPIRFLSLLLVMALTGIVLGATTFAAQPVPGAVYAGKV